MNAMKNLWNDWQKLILHGITDLAVLNEMLRCARHDK